MSYKEHGKILEILLSLISNFKIYLILNVKKRPRASAVSYLISLKIINIKNSFIFYILYHSKVAERLWSAETVTDLKDASLRIEENRCRMVRRGIWVEPFDGPGYCNYEIEF
jgi:hypothetical protein